MNLSVQGNAGVHRARMHWARFADPWDHPILRAPISWGRAAPLGSYVAAGWFSCCAPEEARALPVRVAGSAGSLALAERRYIPEMVSLSASGWGPGPGWDEDEKVNYLSGHPALWYEGPSGTYHESLEARYNTGEIDTTPERLFTDWRGHDVVRVAVFWGAENYAGIRPVVRGDDFVWSGDSWVAAIRLINRRELYIESSEYWVIQGPAAPQSPAGTYAGLIDYGNDQGLPYNGSAGRLVISG